MTETWPMGTAARIPAKWRPASTALPATALPFAGIL